MTYTPTRVPVINTVEELRRFVEEELQRLARSLQTTPLLTLQKVYREPERVRDGMIAYADGAEWNPGSGEGFYGREAGSWVKL